jgi:Protein of unknown function (DUF1559)
MMRFRLRSLVLALIPLAMLFALASAVARARASANAAVCHGNMSQMAIHLLNYREIYGHFPPAVFTGDGTTPPQSWRVLLHTYMEQSTWQVGFGRNYDLTRPWNSPGNLATANPMPASFACKNNQGEPPKYTNYVAVIDRGVSSLESADAIPRGSPEEARHVLLIEYPNSTTPWNEPRDLDVDDLAKLNQGVDPGIGVIFADARFRRVSLAELLKLFGR